MKLNVYISLLFLLLFSTARLHAQNCPENIGFEEGSFNQWQAFAGSISTLGNITVNPVTPINGRHTLYKYLYPSAPPVDFYGGFPIISPNGSTYSVMLGNSDLNRGAERLSYTFTVPASTSGYSFIYNYAVVFQNPPEHQDFEQPRFTARLFDVAANAYIDCGSFEYVAAPGLPGFQLSPMGENVYYKKWSPVTINLGGFEGKTMRLEFTTNDCARGNHFGYAYIDVNENCSSPISGNAYCIGDNLLTLRAPVGFKEYYWYDESGSIELGRNNTLSLTPAPPNGTTYKLKIVPFESQGCESLLSTTVHAVSEEVVLAVEPILQGCATEGVDLSEASVTQGSSAGLTYTYYLDAGTTTPLASKIVNQSGTYYIRGENISGCYKIKPVRVIIYPSPVLKTRISNMACASSTFDLLNAIDVANSSSGLGFSYWSDAQLTISVDDPHHINQSGLYYIKGTSEGCSATATTSVTFYPDPQLTIHAAGGCSPVNITTASVHDGSTPGLTYTYWADASATVPLTNAAAITQSGIYYIKGTSPGGCSSIAALDVTVYPAPTVNIAPSSATFPETVNLEDAVDQATTNTLTYWRDAAATLPLANYNAVKSSGTYYVKVVSIQGCASVLPVTVTINPPPDPVVVVNNAFSPNNDGVNDLFKIKIEGFVTLRNFKIFNRYGQPVYVSTSLSEPWDGRKNGQPVPVGTYYWIFEGENDYSQKRMLQSGSVTVMR